MAKTGYRDIAAELREEVRTGERAPGDRLPSERELSEQYDVSKLTIRRALELLAGEGFVVPRHGSGWYVRQRPRIDRIARQRFYRGNRDSRGLAAYLAEAEDQGRTPSVEVLRIDAPSPAPDWVAKVLGLADGDPVLIRHRRYLTDGEPDQVATSYIPWELAEGTKMVEENPGPGGIYARLEDGGHELERFSETVTARMPSVEESNWLDLPPGSPVLVVVRFAQVAGGRVVEICDQVKAAHRWSLLYDWPAE